MSDAWGYQWVKPKWWDAATMGGFGNWLHGQQSWLNTDKYGNPAAVDAAYRTELYSKMPLDVLLGKVKNPMAKTLFGDIQTARESQGIYGKNDVRNANLALAGVGAANWRAQEAQGRQSGAVQGMLDSGFYQQVMGQAAAQNDLNTKAKIAEQTAGMLSANQAYKERMLNDALANLRSWLANKRNQRLGAQQMTDALAEAQAYANRSSATGAWIGGLGSLAGGLASYGNSQGWGDTYGWW